MSESVDMKASGKLPDHQETENVKDDENDDCENFKDDENDDHDEWYGVDGDGGGKKSDDKDVPRIW